MIRNIITTSLFVLLVFSNVFSQKQIHGVVKNYAYEPLKDVKVSGSDTSETVLTNSKGEYSIEISDDCNVLIYRYKNMHFETEINGRTIVNQTMSDKKVKVGFYRFNVMFNAGGPAIFGSVSGSIMLTKNFGLEAGIMFGKAHAGFNIFFNSPFVNDSWQPYIGGQVVFFEEFMGPTSKLIYAPVGLRYMNARGMSFSVEIADLFNDNEKFLLDKSPVWGGIKFGKYFHLKQ